MLKCTKIAGIIGSSLDTFLGRSQCAKVEFSYRIEILQGSGSHWETDFRFKLTRLHGSMEWMMGKWAMVPCTLANKILIYHR